MFSEGHDELLSSGLDAAIKVVQENVEQIQNEKNEIGKDRHNFDVTQSGD